MFSSFNLVHLFPVAFNEYPPGNCPISHPSRHFWVDETSAIRPPWDPVVLTQVAPLRSLKTRMPGLEIRCKKPASEMNLRTFLTRLYTNIYPTKRKGDIQTLATLKKKNEFTGWKMIHKIKSSDVLKTRIPSGFEFTTSSGSSGF